MTAQPLQLETINAFITLTEQINNSKTNVLDFGSDDMTFFRGEIHVIKMVGDYPGVYSSEIARRFGITRAVIHKTVKKLEQRGFIRKETDDADQKRLRLFLTDKGRQAYRYHDEYHQAYDKPLFDYVNNCTDEQLVAIREFLEHATDLIRNHA